MSEIQDIHVLLSSLETRIEQLEKLPKQEIQKVEAEIVKVTSVEVQQVKSSILVKIHALWSKIKQLLLNLAR